MKFSNLNLIPRLFISLSFICISVAIAGWFTFNSVEKMAYHYDASLENDLDALENIYHLQKLAVDEETGKRGFVITGNEKFLEPYINAKRVRYGEG